MAPRRIEGPIEDEIRSLAYRNQQWSPAQIHRSLESTRKAEAALVPPSPSLRTVERIVEEVRGSIDRVPWSLTDGSPEDAALVMREVIPMFIAAGDGAWPSRTEADFIARVRRAYPHLDMVRVLWLMPYALSGPRGLRQVEEYLVLMDDRGNPDLVDHVEPAYWWDMHLISQIYNEREARKERSDEQR